MKKLFIFNADDFAMSKEYNRAVLEGYNNGFLSSTSLCANGEAFESAINDIIPECPNLSVGVHLNIIEGKALTNCPLLTDKNGNFNKGYLYFMLNSFNKEFLNQVEQEFVAQIEKIKSRINPTHIDSHVHTHAIPALFNITCKLAQKYGIKYVRTQNEKFYFVKSKCMCVAYLINVIKILLLKFFTMINRNTLKKYDFITNDYILGVGYTAMMDSETIKKGLEAINEDCLAEALIHPCYYCDDTKDSHSVEFITTLDKQLRDSISRMGYEITGSKILSK